MEDKKQLKVLVPVETDQRFKRASPIIGPISHTLERLADIEENALARLTEDQRRLYLMDMLTFPEVFGRPSKLKRQPRLPKTPVVQFSAEVSESARDKLKRYCRFVGIPMWDFLDRWSKSLEQNALDPIPPERHQEFYEGKLDAADLLPIDDVEDAPEQTAAPSISAAAHNI